MRVQNLKEEFEDPFGSKLFKKIDDLEETELVLSETTRIDLIKEVDSNYLPYLIFKNRLNKKLNLNKINLIKNTSEIKSAEASSSGQR